MLPIADVDRTNERFFSAATRAQTAPQISVYDGASRSAILRASTEAVEGTGARSGVTSASSVSSAAAVSRSRAAGSFNDLFAANAAPDAAHAAPSTLAAVPDDGFPTQSKVVFHMHLPQRAVATSPQRRGRGPSAAPHLTALYVSADPRPKSKGDAASAAATAAAATATATAAAAATAATVATVAGTAETAVRSGGLKRLPTVRAPGYRARAAAAAADEAQGDEARLAGRMHPSMLALFKRTENLLTDARGPKKATKKKKKRAAASEQTQNGERRAGKGSGSESAGGRAAHGESFRVGTTIATIHEEDADADYDPYFEPARGDEDKDKEEDAVVAMAGGGGVPRGSSGSSGSMAGARPASRSLHSSGGRPPPSAGDAAPPRVASRAEARSRSPHSTHTTRDTDTDTPSRKASRGGRERGVREGEGESGGREPTRTPSRGGSRSTSRPGASRPSSRPTVAELFALSPTEVVAKQQALREMGWTAQRVTSSAPSAAEGVGGLTTTFRLTTATLGCGMALTG